MCVFFLILLLIFPSYFKFYGATKDNKNQTVEETFNATAMNYCKIYCQVKAVKRGFNFACNCTTRLPLHKEILDNMQDFRTKILSLHNEVRSRVAFGNASFPPAANMFVLNYDLELEYIARCWGRQYFIVRLLKGSWKDCLKNIDSRPIGLIRFNKQEINYLTEWVLDHVDFFDKEMISSFNQSKMKSDSLLMISRVLWATNTRIGCSRIKNADEVSQEATICLYRGDRDGGNVEGRPIYIMGKYCSSCPDNSACPLCGQYQQIPKDIVKLPPWKQRNKTDPLWDQRLDSFSKSDRIREGSVILIAVLVIPFWIKEK